MPNELPVSVQVKHVAAARYMVVLREKCTDPVELCDDFASCPRGGGRVVDVADKEAFDALAQPIEVDLTDADGHRNVAISPLNVKLLSPSTSPQRISQFKMVHVGNSVNWACVGRDGDFGWPRYRAKMALMIIVHEPWQQENRALQESRVTNEKRAHVVLPRALFLRSMLVTA